MTAHEKRQQKAKSPTKEKLEDRNLLTSTSRLIEASNRGTRARGTSTPLTNPTVTRATSPVFGLSYDYGDGVNNNGAIHKITDNVDAGRTVNYTYDEIGRLKTAVTQGSTAYPRATSLIIKKETGKDLVATHTCHKSIRYRSSVSTIGFVQV